MDGLIGEVNSSAPDYVFHMNSLEHVGALVPMVRYDDRYATAIAKWVLNAANASRLYYSNFLADDMQDNEDWTNMNDPKGAIAYESLRQYTNGPYGTGDAMNGDWSKTNLGLYGSSHIGIFGAIIEKTNVEGIIELDLLATDYYKAEAYPTCLYYNPYDEQKQIELNFNDAVFDLYDAVSNQFIQKNATDIVQLSIASKSSVMLVILPANSEITYNLNQAMVGSVVIDYNAEQIVTNYPPRIKALTAADSVAIAGGKLKIYCTAEDRETANLVYNWFVDGNELEADAILDWDVPDDTGYYSVVCKVTDEGDLTGLDTLTLKVVTKINYPPVIEKIVADDRILYLGNSTSVTCFASDENGDEISYEWSASAGVIEGEGETVNYHVPEQISNVYLVCEITDTDNAKDKDSILILVRDPDYSQSGELIAHYGFNGNANDKSGNNHNGTTTNVSYTDDMFGIEEHAISYEASNSMVVVPNDGQLNFQEGMTVCYWISVNDFFDRESYPVSHGNWTDRWKTSLTEERLRFTLNGSTGIIDVDSDTRLVQNEWIHVVALYNGMDCLVFINGELSGFRPYSGTINTTNYNLVFGQSLQDQSGFNFKGKMDKLRLYNYGISYEEVKEIYESELSTMVNPNKTKNSLDVYPNPVRDKVWIKYTSRSVSNVRISLTNFAGVEIKSLQSVTNSMGNMELDLSLDGLIPGVYFIRVEDGERSFSRKVVKME